MKVYQSIPYQGENDIIPIGHVWNILHRLYDHEQRRIMRSFVLQTAAFLIGSQPEEAIRYLEPIFRKIGLDERMALIGAIGRLYLQQRMNLPQGEYTIELRGQVYPVWHSTTRPQTGIELILFKWLQSDNSLARELSVLAFMEFARVIDHEEMTLIPMAVSNAINRAQMDAAYKRQQEQQQAMEAYVQYPVMPHLSLWTRIKIFFWLLFRTPQEKLVMKEMMQTFLMYRLTQPAYLAILISRWQVHPEERVRKLAWWLQKLKGL